MPDKEYPNPLTEFLARDMSNGRSFYNWARGFACKLGLAGVAEDIFQKLCLRSLVIEDYNPDLSSPRVYLYQVFHNLCIDHLRTIQRSPKRIYGDLSILQDNPRYFLDLRDPNTEEPSADLEQQEQVKLLHQAMSSLPDNWREIIDLHYFQGLDYNEIANKLGIPFGTVKSRLYSARH
jgi:RNA polymerase sigma-70 factor (ECF subfamily)